MHPPDELQDYLRGGSALSRQYRRESAPLPPRALDRRVIEAVFGDSAVVRNPAPWARKPRAYLAPMAFAASVLLSVALVLAIVFGTQTAKRSDEAPRLVRAAAHAGQSPIALTRKPQLYSSDPPRSSGQPRARPAAAWLADIDALRRAGRTREADAELRRFRSAYPDHAVDEFQSLR